MHVTVSLNKTYNCSVERAFKTAMLCDLSKIHTGFGLMPKVIKVSDDEHWGEIGASKKIYTSKTLLHKAGFASIDTILERTENDYWKIQIDNFQNFMFGFYKFIGEWSVEEVSKSKTNVVYTYALYFKTSLFRPFYWVFAKTFWRLYMKQVLKNIEELIYNEEPYLYN